MQLIYLIFSEKTLFKHFFNFKSINQIFFEKTQKCFKNIFNLKYVWSFYFNFLLPKRKRRRADGNEWIILYKREMDLILSHLMIVIGRFEILDKK